MYNNCRTRDPNVYKCVQMYLFGIIKTKIKKSYLSYIFFNRVKFGCAKEKIIIIAVGTANRRLCNTSSYSGDLKSYCSFELKINDD